MSTVPVERKSVENSFGLFQAAETGDLQKHIQSGYLEGRLRKCSRRFCITWYTKFEQCSF